MNENKTYIKLMLNVDGGGWSMFTITEVQSGYSSCLIMYLMSFIIYNWYENFVDNIDIIWNF